MNVLLLKDFSINFLFFFDCEMIDSHVVIREIIQSNLYILVSPIMIFCKTILQHHSWGIDIQIA